MLTDFVKLKRTKKEKINLERFVCITLILSPFTFSQQRISKKNEKFKVFFSCWHFPVLSFKIWYGKFHRTPESMKKFKLKSQLKFLAEKKNLELWPQVTHTHIETTSWIFSSADCHAKAKRLTPQTRYLKLDLMWEKNRQTRPWLTFANNYTYPLNLLCTVVPRRADIC